MDRHVVMPLCQDRPWIRSGSWHGTACGRLPSAGYVPAEKKEDYKIRLSAKQMVVYAAFRAFSRALGGLSGDSRTRFPGPIVFWLF